MLIAVHEWRHAHDQKPLERYMLSRSFTACSHDDIGNMQPVSSPLECEVEPPADQLVKCPSTDQALDNGK